MTEILRSVPHPDTAPAESGYPPHHPKSPFPLRTAREAGEMCGRKERWFNAQAAARLIDYVDMDLTEDPGRGGGTRSVRKFRNDNLYALVAGRTVEAAG